MSLSIEQLLGVTREEWLSREDRWVSPCTRDRERVVAASDRSSGTGEPLRIEYRAVRPNGTVVWIRDRVLVRDQHGTPMYWLGSMLDVSDDVVTRGQLLEAQTMYGALVEQIPAIVYQDLADESWTTAYVSPQISRILGVDPEEYVGESSGPRCCTPMIDATIEAVDRGIASGEAYAVEYRMIARDGRTVWFRDSAVVLHDSLGRPSLIHGVMLDILERKAAEERAYLAYHDKLTGMPNRAMFDELLELSLARALRSGLGVG